MNFKTQLTLIQLIFKHYPTKMILKLQVDLKIKKSDKYRNQITIIPKLSPTNIIEATKMISEVNTSLDFNVLI